MSYDDDLPWIDDFCGDCGRQNRVCKCGDDLDIDVCVGCGRYYAAQGHRGLEVWNEKGVAPQLCVRCWKEHGYAWPDDPIPYRITPAGREHLDGKA